MVNLQALVKRLRSGDVAPVDVDGQAILAVQVYETDRSQAELYLLRAGQKIPAHRHSAIDDVFLVLDGRGRIRTWDSHGNHHDHAVERGAVIVVEPGTAHEVSCQGEEFVYVLTQSPKERYDMVAFGDAAS